MNTAEARWLARVIRFFGVKALFDAYLYAVGWGFASLGPAMIDGSSGAARRNHVLWVSLNLALGVTLLRYAPNIAGWFCASNRGVTRSLSRADDWWLGLAVRGFGIWLLTRAVTSFVQGLILAGAAPAIPGMQAGDSYYLSWALAYLFAGFMLAKRPDVLGLAAMKLAPSRTRPPDESAQRAPESGTRDSPKR